MLSRRGFLGAAAAAAALAPAARAEPPALPIGYSLYGVPDFRYGDAVELVGRLGYEAIELTLNEGFPTEPAKLGQGDRAQIRALLSEHDMLVAGLMERILLTADAAEHQRNLEKIKRAAQLAHDLAPLAPPPLETILGGRPEQWEELREPMAERLRDWAKVARAADLTIALKAHVGGAAHLPEQISWLRRQAGGSHIRLAYDYSHFAAQGLTLAGTLRDLLPDTVFIHVKDVARADGKTRFLLPGEGDTDYVELFRRLRQASYRGAVVVEVSSQISSRLGYDPIGAAEKCLEFLENAREQALQSEAQPAAQAAAQ